MQPSYLPPERCSLKYARRSEDCWRAQNVFVRDSAFFCGEKMRYISTRGGMPPKKFSKILLGGLAPDGGLAMPETYPEIDPADLERLRGLSYPELAFEIISRFADDIPAADLRDIIARTYTAELFQSEEITPLKTLEPGLHILGLSNGPTLAFKDIAMQLLGQPVRIYAGKNGRAPEYPWRDIRGHGS